MIRRLLVFLALCSLPVAAQQKSAPVSGTGDWPQWRGPARDGAVPAASVPKTWPKAYAEKWRVDIGEGYSSPVTSGGRVFIHSRKDPLEVVTAVNAVDGKTIWQQSYPAPYPKNQYAVKMGRGPNATPLVAGTRIFTFGATGMLVAWDAATGKNLWQKDFSPKVDFSKLFCGTSASPVIANGLVVAQAGSDVGGGVIVGLDPATGAVKWEWKGAGPGYASPLVINVGNSSQIVTMTNSSVVGLDAKTGQQLWTAAFPDDWHENITTPVWTGDTLIVSGTRQGTHAYRLVPAGAMWKAEQLWKSPESSMYMSTPVVADGLIYGMSDKRKGMFVAVDIKTGAVKWRTEGREGMNTVVQLLPQHIAFLTDEAKLVLAKRNTADFTADQKYDLPVSATWGAPIWLGADLILRDAAGLVRLSGK
jgi:outer membrane protein assembly factor BamB